MQPFPCEVKTFPCKYLGLPLSIMKLRKGDIQPLIDAVAGKLPMWKGKLLNKHGRLWLVNSVLSAGSIYHMTAFPLKKWAIKCIDKIRRSFLWKGSENANGGHYLVNWRRVARPKQLGGLEYITWNFLDRLCGCEGCGMSGRMVEGHGWERKHLVMPLIGSYLEQAQP